jgi:crotonobetainyl-CoA:carnitine CoA-transferase CaiB-like acyl-CoA transferase
VPAQNFPTRDGWIVIFCAKDKFWRNLVTLIGLPELLDDRRFGAFPDRHAHKEALVAILTERLRTRTTAEWLEILRGHVPCAPVNTVRQALRDEQVLARNMIIDVDHPVFGRMREVASPIKTDGAVDRPRRAPRLGEHTDAILTDLLGYPAAAIDELRAQGAIG